MGSAREYTTDRIRNVAVLGHGGSGKTTLINCISGWYHPDPGKVILDSKDITQQPSHRVATLGIARTFQTLRVFLVAGLPEDPKEIG